MAFIDIKDPTKRDQIVADYLSTIQHVRERNENDKTIGLTRQIHLEQTFKPIIRATEKAATDITNEIKGEKNPTLLALARKKRKFTGEFNTFDHYQGRKDLDKYYAIQRIGDNELKLGDKEVFVDGDSNITVDGDKMYRSTPGLWSLIMLAAPKGNTYNNQDILQYTDLARRTNLINNPHNFDEHSRVKQTKKYKMLEEIAIPIEEKKEEVPIGSGVQFLPGDIKGLHTKLHLLLAEYRAGNKSSTRNQIVSILDELQRRKRLSKKDYRDINTFITP